ncbi:esterase family protein [Saccharothrix syringae]|uniref:Esterase family protein n=1 Tax=Saccharothrix syringae TaxID=103733 RepID=A0A5Q0HFR1_SACSY|nr:esterase family protein [Saccharothrix syringae]
MAVTTTLTTTALLTAPVAHATPDIPADDGARITDERRPAPRTVDLTISSPAVGGAVPVRVLTPPNWSPTANRTWPVLYLLQGVGDDYTSWTRETDVEELSADTDVLVVMPDAGRAGWYTDWYNDGRGGTPKWETFHTTELLQLIERNYRGSTTRSVAGLSAGGTGALNYAAKHPGLFRAAASYSGLLSTQFIGVPQFIYTTVLREGLDPFGPWGREALVPQVWSANNPKSLAEALRGTQLYVSFGNGFKGPLDTSWLTLDPFETIVGTTAPDFVARVRQLGIPITVNAYGGGTHTWKYWQRELHASWPMLVSALR